MSYKKMLTKARNAKAKIKYYTDRKQLLTVQMVCDIIGVSVPECLKPNDTFSMICTFDGVVLEDSLLVKFPAYSDDYIEHLMCSYKPKAIMTEKAVNGWPCIVVENIFEATVKLYRVLWKRIEVPSLVVTGSIGKTTTKYFLNSIFSQMGKTFCNITNGNTFYYLGFELQRFDHSAKTFIQEVTEDESFSPSAVSRALNPNVAIITNMYDSHIGELGSQENVIKSICGIADGMGAENTVVINADDPNSMNVNFQCKTISVGINNQDADYQAINIKLTNEATEFDVLHNESIVHCVINVPGKHNIYCALQAFAAAKAMFVPNHMIVDGIAQYRPLGFRQNIYRAFNKTIIADCYNASAKSVEAAIENVKLCKTRTGGVKTVVLGDIAEIDGFEESIYSQIADALNVSDVGLLITYGKTSVKIHDYLKNQSIETFHITDFDQLVEKLKSIQDRKHYVYLFKGSRINHLEKAIYKVFPITYCIGMMPVIKKYLEWTIRTL